MDMDKSHFRGSRSCGGHGRDQQNNSSRPSGFEQKQKIYGKFVGVDVSVPFLPDSDVIDGVELVEDYCMMKILQKYLRFFNHSTHSYFPVNWPTSLNKINFKKLQTESFVVAPKPLGPRYLLYVDSDGRMFLENNTQHFFKVDPYRAPQPIPKDTILDGIVARKIVRDGAAQNSDAEAEGELTFVIMDATRVNGVDLTSLKSIEERISIVQAEIMQPRFDGIKKNSIRTDREVFVLDIAHYESLSRVEEYLTHGFKSKYLYPFRFFIFYPLVGTYNCKRILQWGKDNYQDCSFRLKIADVEGQSTGELYAIGRYQEEVNFNYTIDLTDELKAIDGTIIECRFMDNRWSFVRARTDRKHPNGLRTISGKLESLAEPVTPDMLLAALREINIMN